MSTPSHDFVTVDMRGLKAALVARARAERVSVSVVVRRAVAKELTLAGTIKCGEIVALPVAPPKPAVSPTNVKVSIRLTAAEARQFAAGAQAAGLSRSAYLAGLIAGVPVLAAGANRTEHVRVLTASTAEVATLNRNIHYLSTLLSRGSSQAAMQYRDMLLTLADNVRGHLRLASAVLADLQPSRRRSPRHPSA